MSCPINNYQDIPKGQKCLDPSCTSDYNTQIIYECRLCDPYSSCDGHNQFFCHECILICFVCKHWFCNEHIEDCCYCDEAVCDYCVKEHERITCGSQQKALKAKSKSP